LRAARCRGRRIPGFGKRVSAALACCHPRGACGPGIGSAAGTGEGAAKRHVSPPRGHSSQSPRLAQGAPRGVTRGRGGSAGGLSPGPAPSGFGGGRDIAVTGSWGRATQPLEPPDRPSAPRRWHRGGTSALPGPGVSASPQRGAAPRLAAVPAPAAGGEAASTLGLCVLFWFYFVRFPRRRGLPVQPGRAAASSSSSSRPSPQPLGGAPRSLRSAACGRRLVGSGSALASAAIIPWASKHSRGYPALAPGTPATGGRHAGSLCRPAAAPARAGGRGGTP